MITVIGSLNYDLVTYTKKVPEAGETYQANSFENHLGGKGLNEALACARLLPAAHRGKDAVRMIGNVGADSFGKELVGALDDAGVNTSLVQRLEGQSSGVAVILVEEDSGENRILITAGANGQLKPSPADFERYFPAGAAAGAAAQFVILQNEFPEPLAAIDWLKSNRPEINIAYNPSPFQPELVNNKTFGQIDLLILNEGEAEAVANKLYGDAGASAAEESADAAADPHLAKFKSLALALSKLISQDNACTVVITLGSKGSVFTSARSASGKGAVSFFASKKVARVVDTTGAGDTFFGGVVSQLSIGNSIEDAIEFATTASSITIQTKGAAESIPNVDQVEQERKR